MSEYYKMQDILISGDLEKFNEISNINEYSDHSGLNILLYFITVSDKLKVNYINFFDLLIKKNINLNFSAKESGGNCIHYCVYQGKMGMCKFLLDSGADIDYKDKKGNTPLWRAVMNYRGEPEKKEMIEFLISNGADVNLKNNSGLSALDVVKSEGKAIDEGSDPKEWDLRDLFF